VHAVGQGREINATGRLVVLLDAPVVQADVARERTIDLLEDTTSALDGTTVDNPRVSAFQLAQERRALRADAREARHLSVAATIELSGKVVREPSSEGAASACEDERFLIGH
jgi:hypothetical protein